MQKQTALIASIAVIALVSAAGWFYIMGKPAMAPSPADVASTSTQATSGSVPPAPELPLVVSPSAKKPSDSATSKTPTPQPTSFVMVTYADNGFSPFLSEVKLGQVVRFVNKSSRTLWVHGTGGIDAAHNSQFDQGRSMVPGEHWDFVFVIQGTWGYENLNYKQHKGAVAVQPQR